MSGLRPPALVYRNPAAAAYRLQSWLFWLATLGVAGAILGMVTERLRVTDDPLTMVAAMALALGGTLHAEMGRRRVPSRLWRVPDGVVIETPGLLRPVHRFVPAERADLADVSAAAPQGGTRGLLAVRLPGETRALLFDPRGGEIPFGAALAREREAVHGKRRRR